MARRDDLRLMTRVARLYYEQGQSQARIARALDLSQTTISRLLRRAQEEQIVRITVSVPPGAYPQLEEAICRRYGLREAIVADCLADEDSEIRRSIGAAAAYYVENTLHPGEVVGISSWSATLLAMVDAMQPPDGGREARVVQILGGLGDPAAQIHATHLTRRLAELIHGEPIFLPAPGVVPSSGARDLYLQAPYVDEALALFDRVSLALVGIGDVQPSRLLAASGNVFSREELEALREHGAVGDICLRFFDPQGQPVEAGLGARVIGMSLEQLSAVPRSVAVAGGRRKTEAIRGALRGGWVSVLVTDRFTAARLTD